MNNTFYQYSLIHDIDKTYIMKSAYRKNLNEFTRYLRSNGLSYKRYTNQLILGKYIMMFSDDNYIKIFIPSQAIRVHYTIPYTNPKHIINKLSNFKIHIIQ